MAQGSVNGTGYSGILCLPHYADVQKHFENRTSDGSPHKKMRGIILKTCYIRGQSRGAKCRDTRSCGRILGLNRICFAALEVYHISTESFSSRWNSSIPAVPRRPLCVFESTGNSDFARVIGAFTCRFAALRKCPTKDDCPPKSARCKRKPCGHKKNSLIVPT